MTIADAVASLTTGKAAKRPSWNGYLKRVDDATTEGAYTLTFKNRTGTEYVYSVSAAGVITTSDSLTMDCDLFAAMLSTDWIIGDTSEFEASRSGTGTW